MMLLLPAAMVGLSACHKEAEANPPEVRPVRTVTAARQPAGETVTLTGHIEAENEGSLTLFRAYCRICAGRHALPLWRSSPIFSLNIFLAMSLMSMQLWALGGLGPALVAVLAVQTVAAVVYMLFLVFPATGRNYLAAVIAAGFSGISLGATPTSIAI